MKQRKVYRNLFWYTVYKVKHFLFSSRKAPKSISNIIVENVVQICVIIHNTTTETFTQEAYIMSVVMFVSSRHTHLGMPSIKLGDIKYEEYH